MCGITGIWSKNINGELNLGNLPQALTSLKHRGPDNLSSKLYSNVGFGHARLSIIDLSAAANQPFSDQSNRYHLVFNGEIYNYLDLKKELESKGVQFETKSDTEVLLHYLILKGEEGIKDLKDEE